MGINVAVGRSHRLVVRTGVISVNVAMHLSLHRDTDPAPDPAALPDGVKDNAERRRRPPRPHAGALVAIEGTTLSGTTDRAGTCLLSVTGLPDGDHVVVVSPPAAEDATPLVPGTAPRIRQQPSPAHLAAPTGVDFAYRGTRVAIKVQGEKLVAHPFVGDATHTHARVLKGATATAFEVDIKPDWVRDTDARPRTAALDLVLVHHTGGNSLAGDLATFTTTNKSIHYLMDSDGHVIKMVNDADVAVHAGRSRWHGQASVSNLSIGIEIVNGGPTPYTPEQQAVIVELVDQIITLQGLPRHHVVGHEDVGTGDDKQPTPTVPLTKVGRKGGDPGANFPWPLLEARGLGLQLTGPAPDDKLMYAGVFASATRMTQTSGPHVIELRQDLDAIGYSLNNVTSNVFDDHVGAAVFAFQRHFTAFGRATRGPTDPPLTFGVVDIRTAREIKRCTRW
jgi:N-acetylmuramoyl-L-alanine amidase